ncbi:hypothetical protein SRIMHP_08115 [Streptomyces rimosus subsp. rimosus]|uniref:Uncharacterized protein n=1 Tax=Streptomyces rimosus subsp. rimosus TaxID=132474 RepID=A0ABY3YX35_STRRM|nr:hypothetical protein SRIMR7_10285 [Streptomyces rimosus subsp. rimosus]UTH94090.1 hypothetical protein SRIMHP_08115 [Streptomyces rimosus subsp. rimosus]UTJ12184.1 hypothetical protein SRIMDV3_08010 [Streptomyces rimosus subsp. rimosus]
MTGAGAHTVVRVRPAPYGYSGACTRLARGLFRVRMRLARGLSRVPYAPGAVHGLCGVRMRPLSDLHGLCGVRMRPPSDLHGLCGVRTRPPPGLPSLCGVPTHPAPPPYGFSDT